MNLPLNFHDLKSIAYRTIGRQMIEPPQVEMDRIMKENQDAIRELNPHFRFMRDFILARDAWMPLKGPAPRTDAQEMAMRRSKIDRIMRFGRGEA
jgi:hypothetical protein